MPYMSGLELCTKLRAGKTTSAIPAVMLTARGYALDPDDLAKTNIKTVMSKPFSPRQVLEKVKELLEGGESDVAEREAA
jgi:two-component system phosphate regulon response regulator PhoB